MFRGLVVAAALCGPFVAGTACAQGLPRSVGEEVALGASVSGVPCRLRMTRDNQENGGQTWSVMCEGWSTAAAVVNSEPERRWKPDTILAESPWAKRLLENTYECVDPRPARIAGDVEALVRSCKLKDGGWPGTMVGAQVGGRIVFASGAPDVMPQIESAVALVAGKPVAATGQNRQALQDYNVKLLQATLGPDFRNVGLLDVQSLRNFHRLTIELDNMRDYVGAEATALRWLEVVERTFGRDSGHAALPLTLLGLQTGRQGRYSDSDAYFRRAEALVRQAPDQNTFAYHLNYKAGIALQRGNVAEGRRLAEESVTFRRDRLGQTKGGFLAHSLSRLAEAHVAGGDLVAAERVHREALQLFQSGSGVVSFWSARKLMDIASVQLQQNRSRDAEANAREAVRIFEIVHGQRTTTVSALVLLGDVLLRNGRNDEAMASFRKAAQYAAANRDGRPQMRIDSLQRYYNALVPADGRVATGSAADELFAALQIPVDPVVGRAVTLMSARLASGDGRVRDLVRDLQEASRRATLLRASYGRLDGDESEAGQARQQQLAAEIADVEQRAQRLEQQLQSANPRYANLTNPLPLAASALARQLQPGEAVLHIASSAQATYVVLLRDGKASARRVGVPIAELQKRVDALRAGVEWARRGEAAYDLAAAHALHQLLLGPLDAQLDGVRHLIVVPDGPMASLPPALLVRRPTSGSDYREAAWLVRDMAVSVMPSVASVAELRGSAGTSAAPQSFLGFGNPRFTGGGSLERLGRACRPQDGRIDPALVRGLAPLPETQDELKAIAAALKAPATAIVTGPAASLAELRKRDLSKVRILAFATHGLLPGDLPCQTEPALALTPGAKDDDGLLNASEIARLRLDADWVVLSACNTAGPQGQGGEALSGVSRAFIYAGARSLLVTHWPVETTAARNFTVELFKRQSAGDATRGAAMRAVAEDMIGRLGSVDAGGRMVFSYAHPLFWAPFAFVGDPG